MHLCYVIFLLIATSVSTLAVQGRPGHGRGQTTGGHAHRYMCSMTDSSGQEVHNVMGHHMQALGGCPSGSSCSVGPLTVAMGEDTSTVMFCDVKDRNGNLAILRGACRMLLADGREILRGRYSQEYCTDGPLQGEIKYFGQTAQVYFTNHNALGGHHHRVHHRGGQ